MVVVALLSVDLVESVYLVSVDLVVNCTTQEMHKNSASEYVSLAAVLVKQVFPFFTHPLYTTAVNCIPHPTEWEMIVCRS